MRAPRLREFLDRLPLLPALRRHPRATLYGLSLALHLLLAPFFIHDWDGYVFITSAKDLLDGRTPYETVEAAPSYIFTGDGVPIVNAWYAYPPIALLMMAPSYAILTAVLGAAPWVERVAIKLPFIVGDLALAFAAAGLVRAVLAADPEGERRARLVERVILLNPFLIFISAAWGMFDAWMMAFLVAGIWMLVLKRPVLSGGAFALAALVKPFPVLVAPILAVYAFRELGRHGFLRWAGAGIATSLVVCLPFFLSAPEGFLQQVVYNHAGRPPQGFTLVGIPLAFGWINGLVGTSLPTGITPEAISRWSFLALLAVLSGMWIQSGRASEPRALLHLLLATVVGALVVSKVVNEQYLVMPVALASVAYALSGDRMHLLVRRAYTVGGTVAGLFLGYHFFTFLPVDVATRLFEGDPLAAVPRLTSALGWSDEEAFVYPTLIAALALVPALLIGGALAARQLAAPFRGFRVGAPRPSPAAAIGLVALLLAAPLSGAILEARHADAPPAVEPALPPRLVGAYYYLWWQNPSHDPSIRYGNWQQGVTHVPLDGYFTTTAGKIRNDFHAMKAAGIDLVAYSYHGYDKPKLPALVRLAGEAGLTTAPVMDLGGLVASPDHRPRLADGSAAPEWWGLAMRNGTRDAIVARLGGPIAEFSHFPTWWHVDGKPVVFVRPTHALFYDASGEGASRLVDEALRLHEARAPGGAAPSRTALEAGIPRTPDELRAPGNALWRQAYHEATRAFWLDVERVLEEKHGGVHLVLGETWDPDHGSDRGLALSAAKAGTTEGSFIPSPTELWKAHLGDSYASHLQRWRDAQTAAAQTQRALGGPVVVSVIPGYDDRPLRNAEGFVLPYEDAGAYTYDATWETAKALAPDVILIDSWNDFRTGTGIEPTHEMGDSLLEATRRHATSWDRSAPAAPRVLLVTNHLGAAYHAATGDPDGSYLLSLRLQRAAEEALGPVAAVDWNAPALRDVNFSAYDLVVVEPGSKTPHGHVAHELADRLKGYMEGGGRVLVLGSDVGEHLAQLAPWSEPPLRSRDVALLAPDGPRPLAPDARVAIHDVPPDARVLLWLTDGGERHPALWEVARGEGSLAVTAFRPQGASGATEDPVGLLRLVVEHALAEEAA